MSRRRYFHFAALGLRKQTPRGPHLVRRRKVPTNSSPVGVVGILRLVWPARPPVKR